MLSLFCVLELNSSLFVFEVREMRERKKKVDDGKIGILKFSLQD